jgi:hypothetical protein
MDEKIIESVYSVLEKYDKDYSKDGVLANLREWEYNKNPLIELLSRHPNWNSDALAVVFEVTESRDIIGYEVNCHIDTLLSSSCVSHLTLDELQNLKTALYLAANGYSKFINDSERAKEIKAKYDISCTTGQKTSRIINSICQKFGLINQTDYNALFAKLADSLNPIQVKKKALLSVHPCDYLEMSNKHNSWHSCHCLNGGEYHGGTISYMNDAVSMIFYTVDEVVTGDFHTAPKRTRQIFAYGKGILLQSRLYPNTNDETTRDMYRNIVQRTIADCLAMPNLWLLKKEHSEINKRICTHDEALHYRDYEHKCYKSNISLLKDSTMDDETYITIGNTAFCLCCGEIVTETNSMFCDSCFDSDYVECRECGSRLHRDDAHIVGDDWYCDECCS